MEQSVVNLCICKNLKLLLAVMNGRNPAEDGPGESIRDRGPDGRVTGLSQRGQSRHHVQIELPEGYVFDTSNCLRTLLMKVPSWEGKRALALRGG